MSAPRELSDLAFADYLEPFEGATLRTDSYDTVHFDGTTFDHAEAGNAVFMECAFTSVTFEGGRFRRAQLRDVWMHSARLVVTDLAESHWRDGELVASLLAGVEAHGAKLNRVSFFNCKLDAVNFRGAELVEVSFVDCLLRDVDLSAAKLADVSFPGSTLTGVRFRQAELARVDLSDAAGLEIAEGLDSMRGATLSLAQTLDLAPRLAQALGIDISD